VEVAAGVSHPFIGSGRQGGGQLGSDGGSGALSRWWLVTEREAKRRRRRLREGKGGGGRVTSSPARRRWPEAHGGARHGRPSDGARASGAEVGGPDQAGLGRADRVATRPKGHFGLKMREKGKQAAGIFFPIFQTKI
jgi:hypothetical protein